MSGDCLEIFHRIYLSIYSPRKFLNQTEKERERKEENRKETEE